MKSTLMRISFLIGSLLLTGGGAYVWHLTHPPIFEARARLQIPDDALYLSLQQPELVRRAGLKYQERLTELSVPGAATPRSQLRGSLEVGVVSDTREVELSYHTTDREVAVEELQTIVDVFLEDQQAQETQQQLGRRSQEQNALQAERSRMQGELEHDRQREQELSVVWKKEQGDMGSPSITLEGIRSLSKALAMAKLSRIETEQHIHVVKRELQRHQTLGTIISKLPEGRIRELLQTLSQQQQVQTELDQNRKMLIELSKLYGKKHPRRMQLESRVQLLTAQQANASLPPQFKNGESLSDVEPLMVTLREIQQQSQSYEEELQKQFDVDREAQESQARTERELKEVQTRLQATQQRMNEITRRGDELAKLPIKPIAALVQPPWLLPDPISMTLQTLLIFTLPPGLLLGLILNLLWSGGTVGGRRVLPTQRIVTTALPSLQERRIMRQSRLLASRT